MNKRLERAKGYPELGEQLDMLWHSINDGVFGEDARSIPFYLELKVVKDNNPSDG